VDDVGVEEGMDVTVIGVRTMVCSTSIGSSIKSADETTVATVAAEATRDADADKAGRTGAARRDS
jgi:uncharacterized spore protein YtfJ